MNSARAFLIVATLIGACAFAAIQIADGPYMLEGTAYATRQQCIDAAVSTLGADPRQCVQAITITGSCSDVPRPVPATTTIFDPNAVDYAGPGALPGEPQIPWPAEPGVVERDGGVEYTFTDQGTLNSHMCPGSDTRMYFTRSIWMPADYPRCWELQVISEGAGRASCDASAEP